MPRAGARITGVSAISRDPLTRWPVSPYRQRATEVFAFAITAVARAHAGARISGGPRETELLFDLEEKDLNCRGPYLSRSHFLVIGIHPERGRADDGPLDPRLLEGSCAATCEGVVPGLMFPFGMIHLPVSREVINKT